MKTIFCFSILVIIFSTFLNKSDAQNANTQLSNLVSPTAVNVNLQPDKNGKRNFGSATKTWSNIYFHNSLFKDSILLFKSDASNLFFGNYAGQKNTGIYNTAFGINSLAADTLGQFNTAFGYYALALNSNGSENTAIGENAMSQNKTGGDNTAVGSGALLSNISGFVNTALGAGALYSNTIGSDNVAAGYEALHQNISGQRNIAIGSHSLLSNTTGYDNISIGDHAMYNGDGGESNVAIGTNALYSTAAVYNTGVGYEALKANTGGYRNSALGNEALAANTTGTENTAIGDGAGSNLKTGSNNLFIGAFANSGTTGALTNSAAIGYNVTVTTSNSFILGNADVNRWGFGVDAGSRAIKVGTTSANGNGAYLTQGGVWTNASARSKKEDFQQQDKDEILEKIDQLPVTKWKYKGTENEYHYGPMADDFYRLFNVGDDSSISDMDKTGVLFLGLQQLIKMNNEKDVTIQQLNYKITTLENRLEKLEATMNMRSSTVNNLQQPTDATASLEQNIPNPFNHTTTIHYTLPQTFSSAQIVITNNSGKMLKQINLPAGRQGISGVGKGSVNVDASTLAAGAYNYSLVVDGKLIGTKQTMLMK